MRREDLVDALSAAGDAHHEYETNALNGVRDELWPGFYAAYILGRFNPAVTASELAARLGSVTGEPWAEAAADAILGLSP